MEAKAIAKHVRIAPRKVRVVLNLIRGKGVDEALAILRFTPKRAALVIGKVVKSAAANAENNLDLSARDLYVAAAYADEGPTMKRFQPRQRGQAFPIMKRTSHITVVVSERKEGR